MRLLLLAAGKSSRIYNKIKKNKCLININHKSLIRNIVDLAYKNKIEKIDIITGFKPNNIKKDLKNYKKIRFINNSKYSSTDMVYSALLGLKKTKIDTIISYTDIIYTDKVFSNSSSSDTLIADYTFRAEEVNFPSYFALALQYTLASIFATSIARDDGLMNMMETKANLLMAKARNIDAQQQTTRKLATSRFISNRRS